MNKQSPEVRFDAMVGSWNPFRVAQRLTLAEVEALASAKGMEPAWESMHFIGATTAEVRLRKPQAAHFTC